MVVALLASTLAAHVEPRLTPTPAGFDANAVVLTHADISFIRQAGAEAREEISASRSVMDRLSNPQLKSFAQQLIADHTVSDSDLMTLARLKGVEVPVKEEPTLRNAGLKRSTDVDRAYLREMISVHEEALELFDEAATSGDQDIAAFALKTLPSLQRQLAAAQDLQKAID
jgi:putative membrane protein